MWPRDRLTDGWTECRVDCTRLKTPAPSMGSGPRMILRAKEYMEYQITIHFSIVVGARFLSNQIWRRLERCQTNLKTIDAACCLKIILGRLFSCSGIFQKRANQEFYKITLKLWCAWEFKKQSLKLCTFEASHRLHSKFCWIWKIKGFSHWENYRDIS